VLWDEFFENRDWPVAVAVVLVAALAVPLLLAQRFLDREQAA
jgi:ABC-type spermidine/putrescine transport system permease subunit I